MVTKTLEKSMNYRMAEITDTTTYNSVAVVDPTVTFNDAATYTFTPGTTDNVIIGISWDCTINGAGGGFAGSYGYLKFPPIGEAQRPTATDFNSDAFSATGGDTGGASGDMWITHERILIEKVNVQTARDTMVWAGKSSYSWKLRQARRQAGDTITSMHFRIYYLTGTENKGAITVA